MNQFLRKALFWNVGLFFNTPHDNRPDFVLSITTYLDETQHGQSDEHVAVAGFYGNEEQWNGFAKAWKVALGKRHTLHMSELRWNSNHAERRVRELLARLGPVPYNLGLRPVYGAVRVSDYADVIGKPPTSHEVEQRIILCGYVLCLSAVLSSLTYKLPSHAVIKIVCERQDEYALRANDLFGAHSKRVGRDPQRPYFKSIEFIEKESSTATQPGDFLAFAVGKYLDRHGTKKDIWCRPIFGDNKPERAGYTYTREKARKTIRTILQGTADRIKRGIYI